MSERNSRPPAKIDNPDAISSTDSTESTSSQPLVEDIAQEDWQVVPLPGLFVEAMPVTPERAESPDSESVEGRLLGHIQDLNQCNEVLLGRVSQLEAALEQAQQALQQEVERSRRVHSEHPLITAQSQSVAQLLKDLEQANETAQRQTLLAETLEAQLHAFQERSHHLEKECALLRKQKAEVVEQLRLSEATCADLRSRLQRQQQYTLQFKAALEKSLGAAASPAIAGEESNPAAKAAIANPIIMPRSERIQPWSAQALTSPTDQHLLSLVRSNTALGDEQLPSDWLTTTGNIPTTAEAPEAMPIPEPTTTAPLPSDSLGTVIASLHHDVTSSQETADVVSETETSQTMDDSDGMATHSKPIAEQADEDNSSVQFTEPIPWGAPITKPMETSSPAMPQVATIPTVEPLPTPQPVETPPTAQRDRQSANLDSVSPNHRPPQVPEAYRYTDTSSRVPALNVMQMPYSSPSPIVHPLRPATARRQSLSAVELPSFPPLPKVLTPEESTIS